MDRSPRNHHVVLSYKVEIPPSFLAKDESSEQDDSSLH